MAKMNRIQFQPGMSLSLFLTHYGTEAQYRFNRRFDLSTIFSRLLRATSCTGKRTEAWLRLAEDEH